MKTTKKLFAIILAVALVVSLALPVMAADETYTITIHGNKNNAAEDASAGHTYVAYEILAGSVLVENGKVRMEVTGWGSNLNGEAFLSALKNDTTLVDDKGNHLFANVETPQQFAEAISAEGFKTVWLETVAKYVNANLTGTYNAESTPVYVTNTDGEVVKDEQNNPILKLDEFGKCMYSLVVAPGYYLIKDKDNSLSGLNKDYTSIILEASQNKDIYHKGSVPTIDKQVSEYETSGYGETLDIAMSKTYYYELTATLPSDYKYYDTYFLEFVDTMPAGITYLDIVSVTGNAHGTPIDLYEAGTGGHDHGYSVVEPSAENGNKLTVTFNNLKHTVNGNVVHPFQGGDVIVIRYAAKLNENAIIGGSGNLNSVHLNYSNNPNTNSKGTTTDDGTKTYTYSVHVTKYNGETDLPLEDAVFHLYQRVTDPSDTSKLINEYAVVNDEGKIIKWTTDINDVTVGNVTGSVELVSDSDGVFTIYGLDLQNRYYLEEIDAPDGYKLLVEPIEIYLNAQKDTNGIVSDVTMDPDNMATINGHFTAGTEDNPIYLGVDLSVYNNPGSALPSTGGIGTTIFYILGAALALSAVVILITKKRMA